MNRRDALARLFAITGTVAIGAELFVSGCSRPPSAVPREFSRADVALLDEVGDTILPVTDTPGAKAVGIGAFIATMARDCYDDANFSLLMQGIAAVHDRCRAAYGHDFLAASPSERTALLNTLDTEQRARRQEHGAPHYFRLMKELTLLGYFSSEIGCTHALQYVEAPGAYRGDVPYEPGQKGWYNPSLRVS